ncbi:catalase, putative [Talaromyces stipitatus ATCC 10500]|uniref:Catalase, putative n=1 Tax=Talaromyces stipitatus (strain ATCC 10500 / CBS 375.48 / QM 6759 / NRRL 1006) TaxID=441959 RepID=B8M7R7_TALSN|nr:catalase, putative [Talaromyces stipitatus ATCC 10500]EED19796.1 catalase, putative [Talaromyces stipitatus ATCC 10500]
MSYYTLAEGCPYARNDTSVQLRNGSGGGLVLMQDTQLIETLAHFSRERIPERVVHAKAAGAYGVFECTHDCTDITSASFLNTVGKKTEVLLRVSTVGPEAGSADTTRDVHGWAMKLYTDEGNLDWVFNNTPVFFIRDPIKFPSLNRSHKRHPRTHRPDANMVRQRLKTWDQRGADEFFSSGTNRTLYTHIPLFSFHVGNPEGIHELIHLFSDRGTPASLRHINAYSGHTYKFTKEDGSFKYIKVHIKTQLGAKNMTAEESIRIAGENPDFLMQDMFDAIEKGDFPVWNVYVQVMDPKEAETCKVNIFDMTKVWPHKDFPLRQIGKLTLNRNPRNYFTDIEQAAFSPSTMVPGWAPSADPILQARMFAYPDAARYRLGTNYQMLPTNAARAPVYCPFQRDGFMNFSTNYGDDPNYVGSSLKPTVFASKPSTTTITEHEKWVGEVSSFASTIQQDDFVQATELWKVLGREPGHQDRYIQNVSNSVKNVISKELREKVYDLYRRVDPELGERLKKATEAQVVNKN